MTCSKMWQQMLCSSNHDILLPQTFYVITHLMPKKLISACVNMYFYFFQQGCDHKIMILQLGNSHYSKYDPWSDFTLFLIVETVGLFKTPTSTYFFLYVQVLALGFGEMVPWLLFGSCVEYRNNLFNCGVEEMWEGQKREKQKKEQRSEQLSKLQKKVTLQYAIF